VVHVVHVWCIVTVTVLPVHEGKSIKDCVLRHDGLCVRARECVPLLRLAPHGPSHASHRLQRDVPLPESTLHIRLQRDVLEREEYGLGGAR